MRKQHNRGFMYRKGAGLPSENANRAAQWKARYEKALDDGDDDLAAGLLELGESAGWINVRTPTAAEQLAKAFGGKKDSIVD